MPTITRTAFGSAVPFAPYNGATGEYLTVPADNTSEEDHRFWAPYCQGQGILEGTNYELKSWTALYYYAASMGGTLSSSMPPTGWYIPGMPGGERRIDVSTAGMVY